MAENSDENECEVSRRIKELGEKATQLLLFLTFALLAAVTLADARTEPQKMALHCAMRWWVAALFPILICVLPLKELVRCLNDLFRWRGFSLMGVRNLKIFLLWMSIVVIVIGTSYFLRAIY